MNVRELPNLKEIEHISIEKQKKTLKIVIYTDQALEEKLNGGRKRPRKNDEKVTTTALRGFRYRGKSPVNLEALFQQSRLILRQPQLLSAPIEIVAVTVTGGDTVAVAGLRNPEPRQCGPATERYAPVNGQAVFLLLLLLRTRGEGEAQVHQTRLVVPPVAAALPSVFPLRLAGGGVAEAVTVHSDP